MAGLRLVFVDGRPVRWSPAQGPDVARGGITTALLALTRELAARGHDVHVVASVPTSSELADVHFHPRAEFAALLSAPPVDVLVAVPDLVALALPAQARARVAWSGNAFSTGDCLVSAPWEWAPELGKAGRTARLLSVRDLGTSLSGFVAKSQWQAQQQAEITGLPLERFTVIGNGVPLEHYRNEPAASAPHRLVYTSQPRRGLNLLLELLPAIRAHVPDVSLDVYGYDTLEPALARRAAQPGVTVHGPLGKQALARELLRGGVLAYPNTLRETFCTAVAEAQAAGLAVVTSRRGALAERVHHGTDGVLVDGEPTSPEYARDFVAAVVSLLQDPDRARRLGRNGRARAHREYAWPALADRWEQLLGPLSTAAPTTPPATILARSTDCVLRDRDRSAVLPAQRARTFLSDAVTAYGFPTHTDAARVAS